MLIPEPMSHQELADFLRWIAERVEAHDSWEGNVQWMIPMEILPDKEGPDCEVSAVVRYGNTMGQGFIRMCGTPEGGA